MFNIECPYCDTANRVESEDIAYTDGAEVDIDCMECEKMFHAVLSISFDLHPYCSKDNHVLVDHFGDNKCLMCTKCNYTKSTQPTSPISE